jgi:hypothetical protein
LAQRSSYRGGWFQGVSAHRRLHRKVRFGLPVCVSKAPIETTDRPIVGQQDNESLISNAETQTQSQEKSFQAGNWNRISPLAV